MVTSIDITQELIRLDTLSNIVETFQEIATTRMQRVRDQVLRNRVFLTGIDKIYYQVSASYKEELLKLKSRKNARNEVLVRNGRSATVLISANSNLYGTILPKTYKLFIEDPLHNSSDIFIIGKIGKALFEGTSKNPFTYIELSDSGFTNDELKVIRDKLIPYSHVVMYHGLYRTILTQDAISEDIVGINKEDHPNEPLMKWLFEPNLEEIIKYFESQIFSSNLTQHMHESELAKLASRTISLEDSRNNIKDAIKKTQLKKAIIQHQEKNRKQMNNLIGVYFRSYKT